MSVRPKQFYLIPNLLAVLSLLAFCLLSKPAAAEPYLAVRTGLKCMACHVNPTGGGKRTRYGNLYGQTGLAAEQLLTQGWDGRLNDYLAIGGNLRTGLNGEKTPEESSSAEYTSDCTSLYFELNLIPDRLTLYVDEKMAPGGAVNREAFTLLWSKEKTFYLKAGQFFLPHGIRLEDDSAFIREKTGINFTNSDNGMEFGLETGAWSNAFAISNGTSGGSETNDKKQYSMRSEFIQPGWRLGFSYNLNDGDNDTDRQISSLFAGARLFGIEWLVEVDHIRDDTQTRGLHQSIYFLEANLQYLQGQNIKLSLEQFDPNTAIDEDEQARTSLVWEYSPFEHIQFRTGYRKYDGIPQNPVQNREILFAQLHTYF